MTTKPKPAEVQAAAPAPLPVASPAPVKAPPKPEPAKPYTIQLHESTEVTTGTTRAGVPIRVTIPRSIYRGAKATRVAQLVGEGAYTVVE